MSAPEDDQVRIARLEERVAELQRLTAPASHWFTRTDYEMSHNLLVDRVVKMENKLANWDGKLWAFSAAAVIVSTLISWALGARLIQ